MSNTPFQPSQQSSYMSPKVAEKGAQDPSAVPSGSPPGYLKRLYLRALNWPESLSTAAGVLAAAETQILAVAKSTAVPDPTSINNFYYKVLLFWIYLSLVADVAAAIGALLVKERKDYLTKIRNKEIENHRRIGWSWFLAGLQLYTAVAALTGAISFVFQIGLMTLVYESYWTFILICIALVIASMPLLGYLGFSLVFENLKYQ